MQIFDQPPRPSSPRLPRRFPLRKLRLRRPRLFVPGFARRPLTWMVGAEVLVCVAFLGAAAHLLAGAVPAASSVPVLAGLAPAPPTSSPVPDLSKLLPNPGSAAVPPRPGLGQGDGFLGGMLSGLNQDQASFERVEWSALQALSGAIRVYIERVIVPAVEKAAHSGAR